MKFVIHKDTDQFVDKPCKGTKLMYVKNPQLRYKMGRRYMKKFATVESLARFCKKHKQVTVSYADYYKEYILCIQTKGE